MAAKVWSDNKVFRFRSDLLWIGLREKGLLMGKNNLGIQRIVCAK